MHVIIVAGARPNFVKIAPLMPALFGAGIQADILSTGQHYDEMLVDVFFEDLQIPKPRWSLGVGSGSQAWQTGTILSKIDEVLSECHPDVMVVVGDVNSTVAGALAAVKRGVPVVHLEAGLRSFDSTMPEEVNRIITDRVSSLLLTPSHDADENLSSEGVAGDRTVFVGNIMAESLLRNKEKATGRAACEGFGLKPGEYILATCHRSENTDNAEALSAILEALEGAPLPVLLPAHPRVRPLLNDGSLNNVIVTGPVGYLDMLSLQSDAGIVVSDSGGVQEETCLLQTPCVTVRNNTERPITSEYGYNVVVPPRLGSAVLSRAIVEAIEANPVWRTPPRWDTKVSNRFVEALMQKEKEGFPSFDVDHRI